MKQKTGKAPDKVMINVLTLVIWGEKDTAITIYNLPSHQDYIPDLTIKKIPDGSHWVMNEKPEMVSSMIRKFTGLSTKLRRL